MRCFRFAYRHKVSGLRKTIDVLADTLVEAFDKADAKIDNPDYEFVSWD